MAASDPAPGVPTPTGTLLGCARFYWNGTAWVSGVTTPAAPGAAVPTPTGMLQGIAPFYWSGSAWVAATSA